MKYFYALWIPVLERTKFEIIAHPKSRILQDSKDYPKYIIRGEIEEKSLDFSFFYKKGGGKQEKNLNFRCEDRTAEGFLIYSLELNEDHNDSIEKRLKEKMLAPIYHYIKDFFHCHIHHHPSHDSLLRAYFSEIALSFKNAGDRKNIMEHYALLYLEKFDAFEEHLTSIYQDAKWKINSGYRINKGIKELEFLLMEGQGILGEAEFCSALMEMGAGIIGKGIRKDISEHLERIEKLQREISFSYNLCTSSYGVKLGYWGIWFGVGGIFISIFSIITSLCAVQDYSPIFEYSNLIQARQQLHTDSILNANQKEVIHSLDSIKQQLQKNKIGINK